MRLTKFQLRELRAGRRPRLFTKNHPGHEVGISRKVVNHEERVVVVEVGKVLAHEITRVDAMLAGYDDLPDLMQALGYHRTGPNPAMKFEVWMTLFERDLTERPRFMHKDSSHSETESHVLALDADAERPPKAWEDRFAGQAEETGKILRAEQEAKDKARTLGRRVRQEVLTATRKGRDISEAEALIEEGLRKLDEAA